MPCAIVSCSSSVVAHAEHLQDFDEKPVSDADIKNMTSTGDILFGYVPMVDFGDVKLVERKSQCQSLPLAVE